MRKIIILVIGIILILSGGGISFSCSSSSLQAYPKTILINDTKNLLNQDFNQISVKLPNKNSSGYTLFSPLASKTTYLINSTGEVVHTWDSDYPPALSAYLVDNGSILRSGRDTITLLPGGGHIQKISWTNEVIWDFTFVGDNYIQHHDFKPLPNGNIFLIAWEFKTNDEAVQAGRSGTLTNGYIESEFIVEIKPTGPTSGEVVWEWHAWDHITQDYDTTKDNYGIVYDNPQLININYRDLEVLHDYDWIHLNSVDYNTELDQLLLTSRNFNEIWIIDHSTNTTEAASHTGGRYNRGGDLLYRWGNPSAYRVGTASDQKLFAPHDATWIEKGCPGENNILLYNNEDSSVDEIVPPVDKNGFYTKIPNQAFEPTEAIWRYQNPILWSWSWCGAQRLANGNTLICCGLRGYFFEVSREKNILWEYSNPYDLKSVYKIHRYTEIFSSLNSPPTLPNIYGPAKGNNGESYNFTISATDPNNDAIFYMMDWGDGITSGWIGPYDSGKEITMNHMWNEKGTYTLQAKAKDVFGEECEWATFTVRMPFSYNPIMQFLERLFDRFPNMFPILRELFGY